jgi:uncharacterized protein
MKPLHPETRKPDIAGAERFILSRLQSELPSQFTYHNAAHTLDVLESAMLISRAERISEAETGLLRIAVCFHDAGFLYDYHRHEEKGCELARQYLPDFGFTDAEISLISGMILATRFPQKPSSQLEEIIADADLDYLGRPDVYAIAHKLFEELQDRGMIRCEEDWNSYQLRELKDHVYHTPYSRSMRESHKQKYLEELRKAG